MARSPSLPLLAHGVDGLEIVTVKGLASGREVLLTKCVLCHVAAYLIVDEVERGRRFGLHRAKYKPEMRGRPL